MTERKEELQDGAEAERLAWIRPELYRLDAGNAELGLNPVYDGVTQNS